MILKPNQTIKAFTIIELSVVLLIVAIFITAFFSASRKAIDNTGINTTKERIDEIYKALGRYLESYGKIPCPAAMNLAKGNASYGIEVTCNTTLTTAGVGIWESSANSNIVYGMVPVKALGLSADMAEDGFGTKLAYVMIKGYNDRDKLALNTHAGTYDGNGTSNRIRINERPASGASATIVTDSMFVIISYGLNKSGGFRASATTTQNSASTDNADGEPANYPTNLDTSAGKATLATPFVRSSGASDIFDDILFYKSRNQMLTDFNLLSLAKCTGDSPTLYGTTITWPDGNYNQIVPATTACPSGYINGPVYPTKKCGPLGVWGNVIAACVP